MAREATPIQYRLVRSSDLERDGMTLELVEAAGGEELAAEVFASDRDRTLTLTTFGGPVDVAVVEALIEEARMRLAPFEDGTPLSEAAATGTIERGIDG
jgi:hypothetical protein